MEQEPKITISPRKASQQVARGRTLLKSLGVTRLEEAEEGDRAAVSHALLAIELGRKSTLLQLLALAGIFSSAVLAIERHDRNFYRELGKADVRPVKVTHEVYIAGENGMEKIAQQTVEYLQSAQLDPDQIRWRIVLWNRDRRNAALLFEIEPTWRILMQSWIEGTEAGHNPKVSVLRDLYAFLDQHGKPKVFGSDSSNPEGGDFVVASLNDERNWYQKHGITYYEPKTKTLYLADATKIDLDPATSAMDSIAVWFALNDAKTHINGGTMKRDDPELADALVFGVEILKTDAAYLSAINILHEKNTSPKDLRDIAIAFGLKHAQTLAEQKKAAVTPGEVKIFSTTRAYQFVRLLALDPDPLLARYKTAALEILEHPEVLDR